MRTKAISVAFAAILVAAGFQVTAIVGAGVETATAATASGFDAGNIMSDAVFYNSGTMSAPDIQAFLNQQEPNCSAGYTCLKSYAQNTPAKAATTEGCAAFSAQPSLSAAQIIQMVAQSCGINPRVIITILEKEQGLVSSSAPSDGRYKIAMGFGCPDTAACDTTYYGFFNQVYSASRQFKIYQRYPASFRYRAGQVNTIQWSPNACGSSQVTIVSQATAGLYNYTPYRPNQAALDNLYGTGDVCSSYGNRNFWRIFTDWFGSTTISSSLVRTTDSLQIWLLTNDTKYPINNPDTYFAYASSLGTVATVTTAYLSTLPSGPELGRFVGDSAGNLYFIDGGKKFHFDSYGRVADYGYSSTGWIQLSDSVVNSLPDGGQLTNALQDPSGNYWHISGGSRSQAIDLTALRQSGEGETVLPVSAAALTVVPVSAPTLREDIIVQQAGSQTFWLQSAGLTYTLSPDLYSSSSIGSSLPTLQLLPASAAMVTSTAAMTGVVTAANSGNYLVTDTGKVLVNTGTDLVASTSTISAAALTAIPTVAGSLTDPVFLRGVGASTIYLTSSGTRHAIFSWADFAWASSNSKNPNVYQVPATSLNVIPEGTEYLRPGSIVRPDGSADAFLVDGSSTLDYIGDYGIAAQLGAILPSRVVPATATVGMTRVSSPLQRAVTCNQQSYYGVDGTLRPIDARTQGAYGITSQTSLDASTCLSLVLTHSALTRFIRNPAGDIYYVTDGNRRWIPSMAILNALGGSAQTITDMSDASMNAIPADVPMVSSASTDRPAFIRAAGVPTVYIVKNGARSALQTWNDFEYASTTTANADTYVAPLSIVQNIPLGAIYVHPGSFVRADGTSEVFMLDGATNRQYVNSFDPASELGLTVVTQVSQTVLSTYVANSGALTTFVTCGSNKYVGLGGSLYALDSGLSAQYGSHPVTTLAAATCSGLPKATNGPGKFLRGPDGSVYMFENGIEHHVSSPAGFTALGGDWSTLITVTQYTINLFPTGNPVG